MIPKTTKVFGRIHTQSGLPAIRARGFATLDRYEIDNGFVVPHTVKISCDSEGYFEADFWPNSRGSGGSSYTLELNYQGEEVFKESFVVPELEYPVDILDILQLQPYPPVDQTQQILTQTQALLLEVKENATLIQNNVDQVSVDKETTLHAAALAAEQAIRAGISAVEASLSEDSANTSAQSAFESKNSAALSEQNAGEAKDDAEAAKDKAEAWAENPVDAEVEPGQYSAKHHAAKAGVYALSAAQSKADAEAAKVIAEEKALAASSSANLFPEQFAQMATAIIKTQTIVVNHHGFGD